MVVLKIIIKKRRRLAPFFLLNVNFLSVNFINLMKKLWLANVANLQIKP